MVAEAKPRTNHEQLHSVLEEALREDMSHYSDDELKFMLRSFAKCGAKHTAFCLSYELHLREMEKIQG